MADTETIEWHAVELEPSEKSLTRICEAHWTHGASGGDGVKFLDVHQHNACNHTLSGTIEIGGVEHGFIIDNGNLDGTVVRAWGDPEDVGTYDPGPPPEPRTFIPKDDDLFITKPGLFKVYLYWREQKWFKDKEQGYNYDRHFAPGGKTEKYYSEWAETKGMKVGYWSSLPEEARKMFPRVTAIGSPQSA